ncbi:MAG: rod shape-determining protein MreD [Candidatus Omnitrophica bacterium]|nr:rod shape-determining protein MreD [Candidatus Omnitrophota bacterium]
MWFYILALIFAFLEAVFFGRFTFFLVKPNLVLFLVVIFSFYFNFDLIKVLLFCLFCGFLKDAFSVSPLGTNMLIYILLGIILSYLARKFLRYNWVFIIPLYVFATIGQGIIYILIQNIFFGRNLSFFYMFWRILIWEMLYSFIIFFILFKPFKRCVIDKLS